MDGAKNAARYELRQKYFERTAIIPTARLQRCMRGELGGEGAIKDESTIQLSAPSETNQRTWSSYFDISSVRLPAAFRPVPANDWLLI